MGIEIVLNVRHHRGREDLYCPRIRCDWCRRLIEDGSGNAVWTVDQDSQPAGAPMFYHKACDNQRRHRPADPLELWEELSHFLVYLIENSGVDYGKARDRVLEFSGLPSESET